jgi:hypothetical protein
MRTKPGKMRHGSFESPGEYGRSLEITLIISGNSSVDKKS